MSGGAKGIGLGIDFAIGNQYKRKGGKSYIDPAVLSSVVSVISTYGKTNEDADRSILKDKTGKGNDFKLLNFGFAGNSGYGLYGANYMDYTSNEMQLSVHTDTKISGYNQTDEGRMAIKLLVSTLDNIPSYKIKVTNLVHTIRYYYIDPENPSVRTSFPIKTNGVYELPASRNDIYNGESVVNVGFAFDGNGGGATIEQLPDFEGWLCTDGVDDLIESVKPVSEMLEGSNEITVVSIIHQIGFRGISSVPLTNYIRLSDAYIRNNVSDINKTGIYGYTCSNVKKSSSINTSVVNNILGDKNDYSVLSTADVSTAKFSVQGYIDASGKINELSKVAYAGGFIANKVLTTDEINQIIAYFNLDRPGQIIKPQLYCNIKKQGITNDNHAEFNDQLIDFVGGHNIQLNNVGWEGESGIIDGALYLDGINDFGKVTGLPVVKDYTVVADREIEALTGGIVSKGNPGAFILELEANSGSCYSFGLNTTNLNIGKSREISYLSKYSYNGMSIRAGTSIDSDTMRIGTVRDGDTRFSNLALWSLMLFPYSLSEFLLERQLKKYKAGTLYPDMIEFRPVIKSNIPYSSISYSVNPGVYVTEGSAVTITITLENASDKLIGVSSNAISDISISGDNGVYEVTGKVTKSPQKISIVISSYLTMLGNETLISNETLIKNE